MIIFLQLVGCSLSIPDFGASESPETNNQDINKVLDENYTGYKDDDELDSSSITPLPLALPHLNLGNSSLLQVGQKAICIGSPFGLDHSVSMGIISGLGTPL